MGKLRMVWNLIASQKVHWANSYDFTTPEHAAKNLPRQNSDIGTQFSWNWIPWNNEAVFALIFILTEMESLCLISFVVIRPNLPIIRNASLRSQEEILDLKLSIDLLSLQEIDKPLPLQFLLPYLQEGPFHSNLNYHFAFYCYCRVSILSQRDSSLFFSNY